MFLFTKTLFILNVFILNILSRLCLLKQHICLLQSFLLSLLSQALSFHEIFVPWFGIKVLICWNILIEVFEKVTSIFISLLYIHEAHSWFGIGLAFGFIYGVVDFFQGAYDLWDKSAASVWLCVGELCSLSLGYGGYSDGGLHSCSKACCCRWCSRCKRGWATCWCCLVITQFWAWSHSS